MKTAIPYLIVFLFGTSLYLNTIPNKYAYDDHSVVEGNTFTMKGIDGIPGHLFNDSFTGFTGKKNLFRGGRYRPLSLITFSIEYQFFGLNPGISHFINMVLFGLTCVILLNVLAMLFGDRLLFRKWKDPLMSISFVTVLLFAAHPVHTEVTANIKGRDELLALLFGLLAWRSLIRYTDVLRPWQLIWGSVFFFLALMSKESAAPFLILIPLSVYCFREPLHFRKKGVFPFLSLLAAFSVFLLIRQSVLGWESKPSMDDNILSNSFMYAKGWSERYGTTFYTLWIYVKLLFWPHPLTIDYYPFYIPYVGMADPRAFLPLILYLFFTAIAVWYAYKKHIAGYGLLFFLVMLFPVSNLLFIIGPFMGERFLFIPSVGFALALGWMLVVIPGRYKLSRITPFIVLLITGLLAGKTIARNFDWKDNFTLYTTDVKTSVNSAQILKGAGHEFQLKAEAEHDLKKKREYAEAAIGYLEQAVKLNRTTTEVFLLGNSYYEYGDYARAIDRYLETLSINKDYQKAYTNVFVASSRLSRPEEKIAVFNQLLKITGDRYEPWYNKGLVFGKEMSLPDSSIECLLRATMIDSTRTECLSDLGVALAMNGDFKASSRYLEKALRRDPANATVRRNLAASYFNSGEKEKAQMVASNRWP